MKQGRLSLRLDSSLLRDTRHYVRQKGTSLTQVVEEYFRQLLQSEQAEREREHQNDAEQI